MANMRKQIGSAKSWLEHTHLTRFVCYGYQPFIYAGMSQKGNYTRFHFYQEFNENMIYIVLSDDERKEIEKSFQEKWGGEYFYKDTIFCEGMTLHCFGRRHDNILSETFMTDDGEIL